jgi:hypothetical protein
MGRPVIRTPTGERLAQWFAMQYDAMDRAAEECSTDARTYIRGQMKVLERVRDHVLTEVAYAEVEAISLVTAGSTLAEADQWLTDATGEETPATAAA